MFKILLLIGARFVLIYSTPILGLPNIASPSNVSETKVPVNVANVVLNNNITKATINLTPQIQGSYSKLEMAEAAEIFCRTGADYSGYTMEYYLTKFKDCRARLEKASNGTSETKECVRVCVWTEFEVANKLNPSVLNRTAIEEGFAYKKIFANSPEGRKMYADDMQTCFTKYPPKIKYDREGCKSNIMYNQCFAEESAKNCEQNKELPPGIKNFLKSQ